MKRVLIVGDRGQDGQLLRRLLETQSARILGLGNGSISDPEARITRPVDLTNSRAVRELVERWQPEEIYYLAAYHHSSQDRISETPAEIYARSEAVHVRGLVHFLEAIRGTSPSTRLLYAASSLVFGPAESAFQTEETPFRPDTLYGLTKAAGVNACHFYRQTHGVFAAAAFLYNHESPLRPARFVSQKIIRAAVAIAQGKQEKLILGNLAARIDWGYAGDFVEAMPKILALPQAEDLIIATGESHSIQEFIEITFSRLGLDWRKHVTEDPGILSRRTPPLVGNAAKLRRLTGWKPAHSFEQMIDILLAAAQSESSR